MHQKRVHHSVCAQSQRYIIASGTRLSNEINTVERYDIQNDSWEELPSLNIGRYRHGSCALLSSVYVFCGMDWNANKVSSIEILNTDNLNTQEGWRLLEMPILGERIYPGVQALNMNQIVILGGNDAIWNSLSDCFLLNVNDETVTRVAQNNNIAISPGTLQTVKTESNVVVTIG